MLPELRRAAGVIALASLLGLGPVVRVSTEARFRTLYVAPTGADFALDGKTVAPNSIDTPWRTLFMTIRRARPGDTIVVRGGVYREAAGWGAVAGLRTMPIRLESYPGERVVLMGTLQLDRADYWLVKGINVTWNPDRNRTQFLVKFEGGVGWQFLDAEVWGSRGVSNLMVTGSEKYGIARDYLIAGNCIHDNDTVGDPFMNDHNIYLMPGYTSGPGVIERNILFNAENGSNIKAAGGTSITGSARATIRYNTMATAAAGVIIGYGTHHTTMTRNLIGPQVGGSASYNAAILGNHVAGAENHAANTAVYGYPKSVRSTIDSARPITSAGTVWVSPRFDSMTTCAGFHPANEVARNYGRYAP
jgi:hypothetical protein